MRTDITRAAALAPAERDALRALSAAVYPPTPSTTPSAPPVTWAPATWNLRIWDDTGMLVSHVGILTRDALVDDTPVQIGGIGGVKTHPAAQGSGYASIGLREAARFFTEELRVAFALLVCLPPTVSFYERLGWKRFDGVLIVEQPEGTVQFTANLPMVLPIHTPTPTNGTINLCGEPW